MLLLNWHHFYIKLSSLFLGMHIDWLLPIIINNEISSIHSKYHDYHKISWNILLCIFGMPSPGEIQAILKYFFLRFFLRIQNMIFNNITSYVRNLMKYVLKYQFEMSIFINNYILFVQKLVLINISKKMFQQH